jgi:hypothetical protein
MFSANLRRAIALAITLSAAACAATASAQEVRNAGAQDGGRTLDYGLSAGAAWSDNVTRVPSNEDDATIGIAALRVGYREDRTRLSAALDASVQFEHYFDNEYEDDILGGFAGDLRLGLIPERFEWVTQNNFGQVRSDPFAVATPDNRESFNYFTTGPDFSLRLGSSTVMRLSGRYSDTRYEETNALDGNRKTGQLSLIRESGVDRGASLNVVTERIEFDGAGPDVRYDRHQAFVRISGAASRTQLALDLGYTILDDGQDESDGVLVRFEASRSVSTRSAITVGAGQQFSDAGDLFRELQLRDGPSFDDERVLLSRDPFKNTFAYATWDFTFNRTGFGFGVEYGKEDYETAVDLDRDLLTWSAFVERQLSVRTRARIGAALTEEEFTNTGFTDDELVLTGELTFALSRAFELQLQYRKEKRDTSLGLTDYDENRVSLLLAWSPTRRL